MESREVARYLARLYQRDEAFEVAYIQPDGPVRRVERTLTAEHLIDDDILTEFARAEEAGFNVYTSVLPLAQQARRAYDRLWVDQDDPGAPWPFGADDSWGGAAWPKPTTLVRTSEAEGGFRWQAIWLLDGELDEAAGRTMVKRLADQAGADKAVHDPRRVLRVPGLFNVKRGDMARLLDTEDGRVTIEAFDLPSESYVEELLGAQVQNPKNVLGEWLIGTSEGDRSRKCYVAARFLRSCGVSIYDAAAILKVGAVRSDPPFDDRELEHALKSAYHRQEAATS